VGWTNTAVDGVITSAPCNLHGLVFRGRDAAANLTLYSGRDTGGRKIATFYVASADTSKVIHFSPPLLCERGIYLDCVEDIEGVLIHWTPLIE